MGSTANDSARFDLLPAGAGNELETVDDRRTAAVHFSGLFSVSRPWTALTAKTALAGNDCGEANGFAARSSRLDGLEAELQTTSAAVA
jgi:hypothetical protein